MFVRALRRFSYKPVDTLAFNNKECLIVANNRLGRFRKLLNIVFVGLPSGFLYRLSKYSSMGWFNIGLSSGLLFYSGYFGYQWAVLRKRIIHQLYLLDDGKHIALTGFTFNQQKKIIKIKDIINPETSLHNKLEIKHYNVWVIETKQKETFYLFPEANPYYPDVLKEILKGVEIDLKIEKEDIIDI